MMEEEKKRKKSVSDFGLGENLRANSKEKALTTSTHF